MKMEEEEPLSPMARVFQSPGTDCCTVMIIGFKTKINLDVILDDLKLNVFKHPRISTKMAGDGAKWIKTEVNVEDHVFVPHIDLEKIGNNGENFVEDYVSHLTTLPLDKSRPLWDIHILNVKTADAEAVCVIRYHHSLGDGISRMSLIMACTQKTSDFETLPTTHVLKRREKVSQSLRNRGWFLRSMLAIYSTVILIWNTIVDLLLLLATVLFLKDTKTPLKGNGKTENNSRRFCHRIVSLDDIRLIKNAMDMTINDVLMGVIQAALSNYLNQAYDKVDEEARKSTPLLNCIPSNVRVRAGVFVNLRSNIGIQPLADMMAKDSKCRWGNHISLVILPLYIGSETDPLVYLSKAKAMMDRKKNSLHAPILYSIIGSYSKSSIGALLFNQIVSNTTTFISNVIGPMEEISFHGHPIAYIATSVYGHSHALLIHFQSYAEKMAFSITVDPTVIPDPHKLCDEMEKSFKTMKAALLERGLCYNFKLTNFGVLDSL